MAKKSITKNFRMSEETAKKLEELVTLRKLHMVNNDVGEFHHFNYLNQTLIIESLINLEHERLIQELKDSPVSDLLQHYGIKEQ